MTLEKPNLIGREEFLRLLEEKFPEVRPNIDDFEAGLLHCEVAVFRRVMEEAIESGGLPKVEQYIRFVDDILVRSARN